MALKPDRSELFDTVAYYMFSTGEPGGVVCAVSGSNVRGSVMDNTNRRVEYATASVLPGGFAPSGRTPVGILACEVTNIDLSRQILNPYKFQQQIGDKVQVVTKGKVVTNMIPAGQASGIQLPATAYLLTSGFIGTSAGYAGSGFPVIGKVLTVPDLENFAEVQVDL